MKFGLIIFAFATKIGVDAADYLSAYRQTDWEVKQEFDSAELTQTELEKVRDHAIRYMKPATICYQIKSTYPSYNTMMKNLGGIFPLGARNAIKELSANVPFFKSWMILDTLYERGVNQTMKNCMKHVSPTADILETIVNKIYADNPQKLFDTVTFKAITYDTKRDESIQEAYVENALGQKGYSTAAELKKEIDDFSGFDSSQNTVKDQTSEDIWKAHFGELRNYVEWGCFLIEILVDNYQMDADFSTLGTAIDSAINGTFTEHRIYKPDADILFGEVARLWKVWEEHEKNSKIIRVNVKRCLNIIQTKIFPFINYFSNHF